MKVNGKEKMQTREYLFPRNVKAGTVFRYEDDDTLFMKTNNGIVCLEDGRCELQDIENTDIDEYNDYFMSPIVVINAEINIINEEKESHDKNSLGLGLIRRIDDFGRIAVPKELRRTLGVNEGDPMKIFLQEDEIILQKYVNEN